MESESILVTFKITSGKRFNVTLSPNLTVRETKVLVEPHCDIPAQQQRYIFKGRILKDEETLESYKISTGNTVHLVRSHIEDPKKKATAPPSTVQTSDVDVSGHNTGNVNTFGNTLNDQFTSSLTGNLNDTLGGSMNPQFLQSLMSTPVIQSVMQEIMANPEVLPSIIQTNPFLNQVASSNPLLQSTLSNPEFLRSAMNPSMIQAIMNLQQNLQNQNGSNVTRTDSNGLPSSVSPHQQTGGIPSMTPSTDQEGLRGLDIQGMMGRMLQDTEVLRQMESILGNTQGQQNSQLETMMSQILNTSQVSPGTNETSIPPATRFQTQLQQLEDMGFIDKNTNLLALQRSGGDVNAAISWLLELTHGN